MKEELSPTDALSRKIIALSATREQIEKTLLPSIRSGEITNAEYLRTINEVVKLTFAIDTLIDVKIAMNWDGQLHEAANG